MANDAKFLDPSESWYMVPWVGKRRKTQVSQASESEDSPNPIDKLPDELMVEVLCRLPNSKFVIQCKCVCKHWNALVSLPDFVRCFINHKSKSTQAGFVHMKMEEEEEQMVAIVMQYRRYSYKEELLLHWRHPISNFKGFSFSSLPSFIPKHTCIVVGAFNDLLLYYVVDYFMMHPLFLCNVQTRQWLPLPMTVILSEHNHFGFLCEPYYSFAKEKENSTMPNTLYRYSIAILARKGGNNEAFTEFDVQIFSSETGRWSESVLSLPRPSRLDVLNTIGFGFNGRLHIRGLDYIIAFDPYNGRDDDNGVIKCHLIKWPTNVAITCASVVLWQGRLQVSRLVPYGEGEERLDIWFLKNYHTGQWSLQHSVLIQDLIKRSCIDLWTLAISKSVMGVHPCRPHILYLLIDDRIVLCNVRKRKLEIIRRIPKDFIRVFRTSTVLWVTLPLWPSPLCAPLQ